MFAFLGCENLTSVEVPNSLKTIREGVFGSCGKLKKVKIPNTVTNVEFHAFYYCKSLKEIHCQVKNLKELSVDENAFKGCNLSECNVYVPVGKEDECRKHPLFSQFKEIYAEK